MKSKAIIHLLVFHLILVVIWEIITRTGWVSPVLLPSPIDVAIYLFDSITSGEMLKAAWVTLKRLLFGYVIGIAVGLPLGLLCARLKCVQNTLGVLALGLQTLPSVCWVPLAILWFGQSEAALLFVVVMGTTWSILIAADNGVKNIPPLYLRAAYTMGSKNTHTWIYVIMPAAFPAIVSGMKQGWAFAWRSLMAAEIYVTIMSGFGLGQLLHYGRELQAMDQVLGVMAIVIAIGLLADMLLFSPAEKLLRSRWGLDKS